MRKKSVYEPYIGQRWHASDMRTFEIKDLLVQEDDAWVAYENAQTKQQYSCRLEAFRQRFSPAAE